MVVRPADKTRIAVTLDRLRVLLFLEAAVQANEADEVDPTIIGWIQSGDAGDLESLKITQLNTSVTIEIHILGESLTPNVKTFSEDEC